VPGLPPGDVRCFRLVEIFEQADDRVLAGFRCGGPEADRDHEHAVRGGEIDFARERDIAVLCPQVGPNEALIGL
jgi:hypothetical protein